MMFIILEVDLSSPPPLCLSWVFFVCLRLSCYVYVTQAGLEFAAALLAQSYLVLGLQVCAT